MLAALRQWDYAAAQRVQHFIAISTEIQERIRRYYGRESTIIYPPVDLHRFCPSGEPPGDYFLAGGRLVPYKRLDLAVRACSELGLKLLVYGDGRDADALARLAGPSVTFLGRVSWDELACLMQELQGFYFSRPGGLWHRAVGGAGGRPAGDCLCRWWRFGYGPPGQTGEFFGEQTVAALRTVLEKFDAAAYDPAACRANAERFGDAAFCGRVERRSLLKRWR